MCQTARLTTPLKVWRHWQFTARYSWPVRTGLRGACWATIKWQMAVVYASYSLRMKGEAIKESVVRGHHVDKEVWSSEWTETRSRWARRRWQMANDSTNSMRSSAMSDVFSPFHISSALLNGWFAKVISIGYLQSDPCLHCSNSYSPLV